MTRFCAEKVHYFADPPFACLSSFLLACAFLMTCSIPCAHVKS